MERTSSEAFKMETFVKKTGTSEASRSAFPSPAFGGPHSTPFGDYAVGAKPASPFGCFGRHEGLENSTPAAFGEPTGPLKAFVYLPACTSFVGDNKISFKPVPRFGSESLVNTNGISQTCNHSSTASTFAPSLSTSSAFGKSTSVPSAESSAFSSMLNSKPSSASTGKNMISYEPTPFGVSSFGGLGSGSVFKKSLTSQAHGHSSTVSTFSTPFATSFAFGKSTSLPFAGSSTCSSFASTTFGVGPFKGFGYYSSLNNSGISESKSRSYTDSTFSAPLSTYLGGYTLHELV